jgi:hypothetical protein
LNGFGDAVFGDELQCCKHEIFRETALITVFAEKTSPKTAVPPYFFLFPRKGETVFSFTRADPRANFPNFPKFPRKKRYERARVRVSLSLILWGNGETHIYKSCELALGAVVLFPQSFGQLRKFPQFLGKRLMFQLICPPFPPPTRLDRTVFRGRCSKS